MINSSLIKSIQDIMRKDAGVDGDAQRISQMAWMIFLKIFDDKEEETEAIDDNYESSMPEDLRWRNWAEYDEGITGEELLDFINNKLFKELKELEAEEGDDPRKFLIKSIFKDSFNYMKDGTLIRQVINKLNEIDFNKSEDRHIFNDIYEKILNDLQSAGNAGEFYTPRAITQFIVDMVDPKLGEKILDPACGTGGFLVCAIENVRDKVKTIEQRKVLQDSIRGIEKKSMPHLLGVTNLILHDIEVPNIKHDNTLTRNVRDFTAEEKVDVVVTNPPFGGKEIAGIQANFPQSFRSAETSDLFLVVIMYILRDVGRSGMILPDGFLFGEGVKTRIKEKLLSEFNLHTIVRLPNGVFNPYTGIRTNLLFFTKGEKTKDVWYFEHPLPEGYKTYNKSKPIRISEFDLEKEWWNDRENEKFKQYCWKVSIDEIEKRNYNLDISTPNSKSSANNHTKEGIIKKIRNNLIDAQKRLDDIERTLSK
ncbi:N-6 DNA methylase [Halobacteriota archaeon]